MNGRILNGRLGRGYFGDGGFVPHNALSVAGILRAVRGAGLADGKVRDEPC